MVEACNWKDPRDIAKLLKQTRTADKVEDIRAIVETKPSEREATGQNGFGQ